MAYCIGNIIVGVPVSAIPSRVLKDILEQMEVLEQRELEMEDLGFNMLYSAGGDQGGYVGVDLAEIDEADDVDVAKLLPQITPTPEQWAEARALITALPEPLRAVMPEPKVWIVWSSS